MKLGFDNDLYIQSQSAHIRERIRQFGGKLYLEFGGKLYDDYHASRVLPGFHPDSKLRMLLQMKEQVEIVDLVRHVEHYMSLGGEDTVAFGTDFDGIQGSTLEFIDYAGMPRILQAMEKHFTAHQMDLICKENSMRIFREVVG